VDVAASELDDLVGEWLTLRGVAQLTGQPESKLKQLLREGRLVAVRRGSPAVLSVPAAFVKDGALIKGLGGTLTLLRDAGYDEDEALRWLFTADDSLPGRPIDALAGGHGAEVKRRAQALGF
jgi:hypothetical protein